MQNNTETPALTLDAPDLPLSDYRALREGREVTPTVETPSATEADAVAADAEGETAVEAEAAETEIEEPKAEDKKTAKSEKLSARFSELTAKIRTLETQLAHAHSENGRGTGQTEKPAAAAAPAPENDPEPQADKFDSYLDWQKALIKWEVRQDAKAKETARLAAELKTAEAARAQTWQQRVTEAKAEFEDFAAVAQNPDLQVTKVMGEAIVESEIGPTILYHLGENPELAAKIAKLAPVSQVREIGKLQAKLEATSKPEAKEPQTKKPVVSKAPAPHKPVGGGTAATNPAKNIEGMTQAEYRALRESGRLR